MAKIRIKRPCGAFVDASGRLVAPAPGDVVDAPESLAGALVDAGAAEKMAGSPRKRRAKQAETGPEETR